MRKRKHGIGPNELTTFALAGFGFFHVRIGAGAYNRERNSTINRHAVTDRDEWWGAGIRVSFGNRICQRLDTLAWGALDDSVASDDVLLVPDCYPSSQPAYESSGCSRKHVGPRGAMSAALDSPSKCAKKQIAIWRLGFGMGHSEGRILALTTLGETHESHPELFTIKLSVAPWGEMTYRYIDEMKEGARKMVRMLPETVRKGEFRRKALTPMPDGGRDGSTPPCS